MAGEDTLAQVAALLRATFQRPDIGIGAETTADDVPGWDSLTHGLVLMAIERDFHIRFTPAEMLMVENIETLTVGDLARAVDARLAAGRP